MVFFTRLAVSLVLGVISLGGITAEKVSTKVPLKDVINSISDAKVKEEINNLMRNHDMDGAESKMMKYILDYATDMKPENQSEKDEFENKVVKAMKIIHEDFNDLKKNVAFEVLDEVIGMMRPPNGTESNHTDGMPPPHPRPRYQDDAGELLDEPIGMMRAPNGTESNHTDGMPPPHPRPRNQDDAKMMAKIIEDFPDAAAKAAIINDIEENDFAMAETHMLNALGDMMPIIDDKVREDVHKGMVALKAAVEQYAKEKKEEILIETLEKIKEDQERIEGLLKELGANN